MRKGNYLSVLVISLYWATFIASIHAGPWVPVDSAGGSSQRAAQLISAGEGVALSGQGLGINNMLQFKSEGHLLGFQPRKAYFASLDHALSVEFLGTPGVMPKKGTGRWETGKEPKVPSPGSVVYQDLWEGISLTYEAREGGIAESTYHIGPRADVSKIRLKYNAPVEAQGDGSLKFKFDRGYLMESSPEAWQEIGWERVPVAVAFRVRGNEIGFSVGPYDPSYPLTIDPTYAWHSFYGSNDWGDGYSMATDRSGNVYVTGYSESTWNGPAGQSPLHAYGENQNIFILKLSDAIHVSKDGLCNGNDPCSPNIQNGIASASVSSLIRITQENYSENIILNLDQVITLQGGWDTSFSSISSSTTIQGSITITHGMMILENIIFK